MLLDNFASEMNQCLYVTTKKVIRNADYTLSEQWFVDITPHKACVYSKALAEKYFGVGLWKESVKYVAVTYPFPLSTDDRITLNGLVYAVDSVDDVAMQGEVMLIGLRTAK
jgi:hypothetical protein